MHNNISIVLQACNIKVKDVKDDRVAILDLSEADGAFENINIKPKKLRFKGTDESFVSAFAKYAGSFDPEEKTKKMVRKYKKGHGKQPPCGYIALWYDLMAKRKKILSIAKSELQETLAEING